MSSKTSEEFFSVFYIIIRVPNINIQSLFFNFAFGIFPTFLNRLIMLMNQLIIAKRKGSLTLVKFFNIKFQFWFAY